MSLTKNELFSLARFIAQMPSQTTAFGSSDNRCDDSFSSVMGPPSSHCVRGPMPTVPSVLQPPRNRILRVGPGNASLQRRTEAKQEDDDLYGHDAYTTSSLSRENHEDAAEEEANIKSHASIYPSPSVVTRRALPPPQQRLKSRRVKDDNDHDHDHDHDAVPASRHMRFGLLHERTENERKEVVNRSARRANKSEGSYSISTSNVEQTKKGVGVLKKQVPKRLPEGRWENNNDGIPHPTLLVGNPNIHLNEDYEYNGIYRYMNDNDGIRHNKNGIYNNQDYEYNDDYEYNGIYRHNDNDEYSNHNNHIAQSRALSPEDEGREAEKIWVTTLKHNSTPRMMMRRTDDCASAPNPFGWTRHRRDSSTASSLTAPPAAAADGEEQTLKNPPHNGRRKGKGREDGNGGREEGRGRETGVRGVESTKVRDSPLRDSPPFGFSINVSMEDREGREEAQMMEDRMSAQERRKSERGNDDDDDDDESPYVFHVSHRKDEEAYDDVEETRDRYGEDSSGRGTRARGGNIGVLVPPEYNNCTSPRSSRSNSAAAAHASAESPKSGMSSSSSSPKRFRVSPRKKTQDKSGHRSVQEPSLFSTTKGEECFGCPRFQTRTNNAISPRFQGELNGDLGTPNNKNELHHGDLSTPNKRSSFNPAGLQPRRKYEGKRTNYNKMKKGGRERGRTWVQKEDVTSRSSFSSSSSSSSFYGSSRNEERKKLVVQVTHAASTGGRRCKEEDHIHTHDGPGPTRFNIYGNSSNGYPPAASVHNTTGGVTSNASSPSRRPPTPMTRRRDLLSSPDEGGCGNSINRHDDDDRHHPRKEKHHDGAITTYSDEESYSDEDQYSISSVEEEHSKQSVCCDRDSDYSDEREFSGQSSNGVHPLLAQSEAFCDTIGEMDGGRRRRRSRRRRRHGSRSGNITTSAPAPHRGGGRRNYGPSVDEKGGEKSNIKDTSANSSSKRKSRSDEQAAMFSFKPSLKLTSKKNDQLLGVEEKPRFRSVEERLEYMGQSYAKRRTKLKMAKEETEVKTMAQVVIPNKKSEFYCQIIQRPSVELRGGHDQRIKENRLKREREAKKKMEMRECVFHPEINPKSREITTNFEKRQSTWLERRDEKLRTVLDQREKMENDTNTFKPEISDTTRTILAKWEAQGGRRSRATKESDDDHDDETSEDDEETREGSKKNKEKMMITHNQNIPALHIPAYSSLTFQTTTHNVTHDFLEHPNLLNQFHAPAGWAGEDGSNPSRDNLSFATGYSSLTTPRSVTIDLSNADDGLEKYDGMGEVMSFEALLERNKGTSSNAKSQTDSRSSSSSQAYTDFVLKKGTTTKKGLFGLGGPKKTSKKLKGGARGGALSMCPPIKEFDEVEEEEEKEDSNFSFSRELSSQSQMSTTALGGGGAGRGEMMENAQRTPPRGKRKGKIIGGGDANTPGKKAKQAATSLGLKRVQSEEKMMEPRMIHPVPARLEDDLPSPRKYRRPRHQPPPFKRKKNIAVVASSVGSVRKCNASYMSVHEALQAQKMEKEVHGKSFGRSCEEDDFQAVRDVLGEDDTLTDDNVLHAHLLSARGSSTSSTTRGRPVRPPAAYTKQQQQPSRDEAWDYLIEDDFAHSDRSSSSSSSSGHGSALGSHDEEEDLINASFLNVDPHNSVSTKEEGKRKECTNIMYDDSLVGILQLVEAAAMES